MFVFALSLSGFGFLGIKSAFVLLQKKSKTYSAFCLPLVSVLFCFLNLTERNV
jgi:hypothetical protein